MESVDPFLSYFKPTVLNLGVQIDTDSNLHQQINSDVNQLLSPEAFIQDETCLFLVTLTASCFHLHTFGL